MMSRSGADAPMAPASLPGAGPGGRRGSTLDRVDTWLRGVAFPFWADVGVDRLGPGFVEHLGPDGFPADVPFKRVRVQARQIYCFCQAAELGWRPDAIAIAQRGVDLLIGSAWQGVNRGWVSTLTREGAPLQRRPDLYDIAFVLFALGWWHKVTGDGRVIPLACQTLDFLAAHMRHPSGRGYQHRLDGEAPHLQNPHMHLTEAMIVLRDATQHPRFAEEADRLVELCLTRFYHEPSATLGEEFDAGWVRDPAPRAALVEPGHHYEWVWLLHSYTGTHRPSSDVESAMRRLFEFAARFGQGAASGLVLDAVRADGSPAQGGHRLWPQAERLKAWLAMAERYGADCRRPVTQGVEHIFDHFLDVQPAGTWIDQRTPTLAPRGDKIPSSSFYHLVLAFAEVLRLRPLLEDGPGDHR